MKKKLIVLGLLAGINTAQAGYLHNSDGETVRNGDGECVNAQWGFSTSDCDVSAPEKAVTLPAKVEVQPEPQPVVEETPVVAPTPVMPLPGEGVALTDEVAKVVQPPFVHNSVYFDTDKDGLTKDSQATLNALVEKAKVMNVDGLVVQGYADIRGSDRYNKALSERRNQSVVNYLNPLFRNLEVT